MNAEQVKKAASYIKALDDLRTYLKAAERAGVFSVKFTGVEFAAPITHNEVFRSFIVDYLTKSIDEGEQALRALGCEP